MQSIPHYGFTMEFKENGNYAESNRLYSLTKNNIERNVKECFKELTDNGSYYSAIYDINKRPTNLNVGLIKQDDNYIFGVFEPVDRKFINIGKVNREIMDNIHPDTWFHLGEKIKHKMSLENTNSIMEQDILKVYYDSVDSPERIAAAKKNQFTDADVKNLTELIKQVDEDDVTYGHTTRVGGNVYALYKEMGTDEKTAQLAGKAALLHDVGKLFIDNELLNAPRKLTDDEFEEIKTHTLRGCEFLRSLGAPEEYQVAALFHHQSGKQYPFTSEYLKEKGINRIPELAEAINIVDVYDALYNKRGYKNSMTDEEVKEIMDSDFKNGKYNPRLYKAFVKALDKGVLNFNQGQEPVVPVLNKESKYSYEELNNKRVSFAEAIKKVSNSNINGGLGLAQELPFSTRKQKL